MSGRSFSGTTLVARSIAKSFGPKVVLDDISVLLAPGRKVGVVAPNGTGKSTLLKILAGVEAADGGVIELAPPTATVGYLPQEPDRRVDETLMAFLARRTGVAAATHAFEAASAALADGGDDADDAFSAALDRYLALGCAEFDASVGEVCASVGLSPRLLELRQQRRLVEMLCSQKLQGGLPVCFQQCH